MNKVKKKKQKEFGLTDILFIDECGNKEVDKIALKKFRRQLRMIMNKYKVFRVDASLSPFEIIKSKKK